MYQSKHSLIIFLFFSFILAGKTQVRFQEVTQSVGIDHYYSSPDAIGGGAAFFDIDNDGDDDLWITGGENRDALYENNGQGQFTDISIPAGLVLTQNIVTTGISIADFDQDGFQDVLLLSHLGSPNVLLQNNGDRTFTAIQNLRSAGQDRTYAVSASITDVNLDGWPDIYIANYIQNYNVIYASEAQDTVIGFAHDCATDQLFINQGNWQFEEQGQAWGIQEGGCGLATLFTDVDQDNDPDLIVVNDFGEWIQPNFYYENQYPEPTFLAKGMEAGLANAIYGMGIAAGDYDGDLDQDYYYTNIGPNLLMEQNEQGQFFDQALRLDVQDRLQDDDQFSVGWAANFADFDNDADLDLLVANGFIPTAPFLANGRTQVNRLFLNDGFAQFTKVDQGNSSAWGRGIAISDIDLDGDLDYLVVNNNVSFFLTAKDKVQLFRNESNNNNHWLGVVLESGIGVANGLGAKLFLYHNGKIQYHEVLAGQGSHASQSSSINHFGLGTDNRIDSLEIIWPDGETQIENDLAINKTHHIKRENLISSNHNRTNNSLIDLNVYPNPFNNSTTISFELSKPENVTIEAFNLLGQRIKYVHLGKQSTVNHLINISNRGSYLIKVRTPKHIEFRTITGL
ncbi:MAG: FG-GAP-like repeat-containing protein [Bacteroidota bacterium]